MFQQNQQGVLSRLINGKLCCKKNEQEWMETGLAPDDIENHFKKLRDQYSKLRASKYHETETACTQKSKASSKVSTNVLSISQWRKKNRGFLNSQANQKDYSLTASTIIDQLWGDQCSPKVQQIYQDEINYKRSNNCHSNTAVSIKTSYYLNQKQDKNYANRRYSQCLFISSNQKSSKQDKSINMMEESQVQKIFSKLN